MTHGPLTRLLALERVADVADAVAPYAEALRALAAAFESRDDVRAEVSAWLLGELGLDTAADGAWREALWDAAADVLGDAPGLARLMRTAADRLDAGARPERLHLASLLRAKVVWRARDGHRRRAALQARLAASDPDAAGRPVQARYLAALVVQRLAARFGDDPALARILEHLFAGDSVTEVAAAAGLSRQAVYRRLEHLRAWIDGADVPATWEQSRGRV